MSYPLDPPQLGWGRNCVSLGTLSTLESPLLRRQRAMSSSRCWIAAMVHRRGGSTAEMGVVGRLKCNVWRKGCGAIDAAPQSHVKSTKKEYPTKREVMGYQTLPVAPLESTRHQRKDKWGDRPGEISALSFYLSFFTLACSLLFGPSRRTKKHITPCEQVRHPPQTTTSRASKK